MKVVGQSGVVDYSPLFGLVQLNDGKITVVDQFGSVKHFPTLLLVALTCAGDDFFWHTESHISIVTAPLAPLALRVLLDGMDARS
jgi:hypothetical protein